MKGYFNDPEQLKKPWATVVPQWGCSQIHPNGYAEFAIV
jgi:hypothetical protein